MIQSVIIYSKAIIAGITILLSSVVATAQNGKWYYSGPHDGEVQHLLGKITGWTLPSCPTCTDGTTPQVNINTNSDRDIYVASAVTTAWAVESYAKTNQLQKATEQAKLMHEYLASANSLCSSAPTLSGGYVSETLKIWPCPAPSLSSSTKNLVSSEEHLSEEYGNLKDSEIVTKKGKTSKEIRTEFDNNFQKAAVDAGLYDNTALQVGAVAGAITESVAIIAENAKLKRKATSNKVLLIKDFIDYKSKYNTSKGLTSEQVEESAQLYYYIYKGITRVERRNGEELINASQKLISLNQYDPSAYIALGLSYMLNKEFLKAEMAFNSALQYSHEFSNLVDVGAIYNNLGVVYHRTKRFEEASKAYKKANELVAYESKELFVLDKEFYGMFQSGSTPRYYIFWRKNYILPSHKWYKHEL